MTITTHLLKHLGACTEALIHVERVFGDEPFCFTQVVGYDKADEVEVDNYFVWLMAKLAPPDVLGNFKRERDGLAAKCPILNGTGGECRCSENVEELHLKYARVMDCLDYWALKKQPENKWS